MERDTWLPSALTQDESVGDGKGRAVGASHAQHRQRGRSLFEGSLSDRHPTCVIFQILTVALQEALIPI
jgi:hypothetical protein